MLGKLISDGFRREFNGRQSHDTTVVAEEISMWAPPNRAARGRRRLGGAGGHKWWDRGEDEGEDTAGRPPCG